MGVGTAPPLDHGGLAGDHDELTLQPSELLAKSTAIGAIGGSLCQDRANDGHACDSQQSCTGSLPRFGLIIACGHAKACQGAFGGTRQSREDQSRQRQRAKALPGRWHIWTGLVDADQSAGIGGFGHLLHTLAIALSQYKHFADGQECQLQRQIAWILETRSVIP